MDENFFCCSVTTIVRNLSWDIKPSWPVSCFFWVFFFLRYLKRVCATELYKAVEKCLIFLFEPHSVLPIYHVIFLTSQMRKSALHVDSSALQEFFLLGICNLWDHNNALPFDFASESGVRNFLVCLYIWASSVWTMIWCSGNSLGIP